MTVTKDQIKQFHEEGYYVFEKIISEQDLAGLRVECEKHLHLQIASMERVGAETLGLSHKEKRYTLPCRHEESPFLEAFLFGEVMMEIIKSLLGNDAYLFLELFVVKWPKTGLPFAWHQDSGYLHDLVGYLGADPGVAIPVLSGSVIAMSSLTFHRSGANITDKPRRAFLASYSPEPIADRNGGQWNLAVPFLKNGKSVFESTARSLLNAPT